MKVKIAADNVVAKNTPLTFMEEETFEGGDSY
jgi:hypothetical protein